MEKGPTLGSCLHTPPSPQYPHGRVKRPGEYDTEYVKRMQKDARLKSAMASERVGYPQKDPRYVLHLSLHVFLYACMNSLRQPTFQS